jgi:hypothetical protein
MGKRKVYQELAMLVQARLNCEKAGNSEWHTKHTEKAESIVWGRMPSGSGIDNGTKLNWDESKPEKLVFDFGFHHMNDGGYYDGWTAHQAIVTPSLASGFDLRITGRNRNEIKDYLHEVYSYALDLPVEELVIVP